MKIAIQHRKGSFSDRWINYCEEKYIEYKIVNAYANDIIQQVEGCDYFMWHFHQGDYRDMQMAKALILSLETKGVKCFPDSRTCWHFDNKVWEKYLLEATGAPLVPSYVFYTEKEALAWAATTTFPKVFKLKGGAGSSNVKLAHTRNEAEKFIKQCFSSGFLQYRWQDQFCENYNKYKEGKRTLRDVMRPIKYAFKKYPTVFSHYHQKEIGYAYFQDFVSNNYFDCRVIVVGDKAFAVKRMVREHDFRASGSGNIHYNRIEIPEECVRASFEVSKKLETQSLALDYVFGEGDKPCIVEISYGFATSVYDNCEGYWTKDMEWHEEAFRPQEWMVQDLIKESQMGEGKIAIVNELMELFAKYHISISSKNFDLRVIVIGDKAMGEKRQCREDDFRASGSGRFEYVPIREDVLGVAFSTAKSLGMQSVAFDFIFRDNNPLIVEMSYGFGTHGISHSPGYYTSDMAWHVVSHPDFCGWMVENLLNNQ